MLRKRTEAWFTDRTTFDHVSQSGGCGPAAAAAAAAAAQENLHAVAWQHFSLDKLYYSSTLIP